MTVFDLDDVLGELENYNFLKIDKKSSKQLYGKFNIKSNYKKYELA
jgi:hypothetical protein